MNEYCRCTTANAIANLKHRTSATRFSTKLEISLSSPTLMRDNAKSLLCTSHRALEQCTLHSSFADGNIDSMLPSIKGLSF